MTGPASPPPLLSVIVANFNNKKYVPECLSSILDQTFKDLEIVVYDDGSTDGSLAVFRNYQQRYPGLILAISDPVNRGVAHARHQAILAARGEYLTTLDSDDYYCHTCKLEKEMTLVDLHQRNSKCDIIAYSNIMRVNEDGSPQRLMGRPENIREGCILNELISRACMIPRDFIMKKSAYFAAGGYDSGLRTHEDWDLKIRLAVRVPFYYSNLTGTSYRQHPGGLSSLPGAERTKNMWQVFNKNIQWVAPEERDTVKAAFATFMAQRQKCLENPAGRSEKTENG